jgi:CDP-diglyceride synthetase
MQFLVLLMLLGLLGLANGAPVIATKLFGSRFAQPLDGGVKFIDGRPLFGASKTIRGIVASIATTGLGALVLGLELPTGALIGATAMAGDLCSSFVKRRLNLAPGSRATGLDQIPESLLPLLACRGLLGLSLIDIVAGVAGFLIGALLLSSVFFRLGLRDRPY